MGRVHTGGLGLQGALQITPAQQCCHRHVLLCTFMSLNTLQRSNLFWWLESNLGKRTRKFAMTGHWAYHQFVSPVSALGVKSVQKLSHIKLRHELRNVLHLLLFYLNITENLLKTSCGDKPWTQTAKHTAVAFLHRSGEVHLLSKEVNSHSPAVAEPAISSLAECSSLHF